MTRPDPLMGHPDPLVAQARAESDAAARDSAGVLTDDDIAALRAITGLDPLEQQPDGSN